MSPKSNKTSKDKKSPSLKTVGKRLLDVEGKIGDIEKKVRAHDLQLERIEVVQKEMNGIAIFSKNMIVSVHEKLIDYSTLVSTRESKMAKEHINLVIEANKYPKLLYIVIGAGFGLLASGLLFVGLVIAASFLPIT